MKVVQLPAIANEGRFANKLVHYIVGKCYAESIGSTVEIPRGWIGELLFEIDEPYIERPSGAGLGAFFNLPHRLVDPCLTRETVKRLLKWRLEYLRVKEKPEIAVHLRRGDFLTDNGFPVVSPKDLLKAASNQVVGLPILVSESNPVDSGLFPKSLSFLEDFQTLMNAENVFVYPRSTFSQMAALLGNGNIYMPYDYTAGLTSCKFRQIDPSQPVVFPTKNNSLP